MNKKLSDDICKDVDRIALWVTLIVDLMALVMLVLSIAGVPFPW